MSDFYSGRSLPLISRFEWSVVSLGVVFCLLAWPLNDYGWLSNIAAGVGVGLIGVFCGSLAKEGRLRKLVTGQGLDPKIRVYVDRTQYSSIVRRVDSAKEIDIYGLSLAYVIDFLRDNSDDVFRRIARIRMILPHNEKVCNERDRSQGSAIGSTWRSNLDRHEVVSRLVERYPAQLSVRYSDVHPYCALTRIDNRLFVAPYVTKGGNSSPVLVLDSNDSTRLFNTYRAHFERVWELGFKQHE